MSQSRRLWSGLAGIGLAVCAVGLSTCGGGASAAAVHEFGGPTMGSWYVVKFVGERPVAEVRDAVELVLDVYDRSFSAWRGQSELQRLNRHRSREPFALTPTFAKVLRQALDLAAATDGAFDPTIAPISAVYRAAKAAAQFDEAALLADLQAARAHVDWRKVELRGDSVVKLDPEVALDLDGIVAGACADDLAVVLLELGVRDFLLDITGEFVARGAKPGGVPWNVGIVDPVRAMAGHEQAFTQMPLRGGALCTSGSYRNFVESGGRVWHHIFDPRTGRNAGHAVVSVSVLCRSAALADGLGTALMVLGPDGAEAVLQRVGAGEPVGALFLLQGNDGAIECRKVAWPE